MANPHAVSSLIGILNADKTIEEKCSALKHFRSNFAKDKFLENVTDHDFITIYKILVCCDDKMLKEASCTLSIVLMDQKYTKPNFLQSVQQMTSRENRIKVFSILEKLNDNTITMLANDAQAINFINDCLKSVSVETMSWLSPTGNADNLEKLIEREKRTLTENEELESKIVMLSFDFFSRLYKNVKLISSKQIQMYDSLVMDKIVPLVYMGLRNQRQSALQVFNEAIVADLGVRVRQMLPNAWISYKKSLQDVYWSRMCLLVSACYPDWATLWNYSIKLLAKDLHRGAGLINNLLSVEEKAFKSSDTNIRKQAFYSWKLLVDNFALDPQELSSARRIKLLCIPLIAKNSKTEMIAFAKFEVWWHLIVRVYNDLPKVVSTVLIPFLNFCFGPLGDTPLLSSKVDICASPGKRFPKTKLASLDALLQFLNATESDRRFFTSVLQERLPQTVATRVFEESYKTFTHSVFEAFLILGQFEERELPNRHLIGTVLWKNLILKYEESKVELKDVIYKDLIIVITEMTNHISNNLLVKNLLYNVILINLAEITGKFVFADDTLPNLIMGLLKEINLNYHKKDCCEAIKKLLLQYINDNNVAHSQQSKLQLLNCALEKLQGAKPEISNMNMLVDMWCMLAEVLSKWLENCQTLSKGDAAPYYFSTIYAILTYPFSYLIVKDTKQVQKVIQYWWLAYKQFDLQTDLEANIKSNHVIITTSNKLRDCLKKEKGCFPLYAGCLNSLITNINYESLLALEEVPSIVHLINDLVLRVFKESEYVAAEIILRSLSAFMITVYGQDRKKSMQYLEVIRPSIEFILSQKADENLMKEIAGTWDTVVTIFKGLNNNLTYNLLSSFQKSIVLALCHTSQEIISQALVILGLADNLDEKSNKLLRELGSFTKKSIDTDLTTDTKLKPTKIAGSFLNRKATANLISDSDFVIPSTLKVTEKSSRKSHVTLDADSQDYVVIKSDVKFDINRLTDHQKESLKKRRDDIPALYNDLSQSGSQDSLEIQKWFEKKQSKIITSKERNSCDSNKENKESLTEKTIETREINSESVTQNESETDIDPKEVELCVANKLNYTFEEECPENKTDVEIRSSNGSNTLKVSPECSNGNDKKNEELKSLPQSSNKAKTRFKSIPNYSENAKRGKRKADDDEAEITKRKKLHSSESSDNDSIKSSENEEVLNKRVKSEISRLQIDMVRSVFEPLPNRRRSKLNECTCKDPSCKKNHSPGRLRSEMKAESARKLNTPFVDSAKKRTRKLKNKEEEKSTGRKSLPKLDIIKSVPVLEDKLETKKEESLLNGEAESVVVENSQDLGDIVEGSQDVVSKSKLSNRVSEKELLIKLDKMNSTQKADTQAIESEKIKNINETKEASSLVDEDETFVEVVEIQPLPDTSDKRQEEAATSTVACTSPTSSSSVKYTTVHISSPKGIVKRTKVKAYPLQGRAAQMLGLVTKQGLMEKDSKIEDEIKKSLHKPKNQESESAFSMKRGNVKESEKVGNQPGTRQEKIFSNMKSADYGSSPPGKLFGGLKNDGEKISPKIKSSNDSNLSEKLFSNEKGIDDDEDNDNDNDNLSPTKDRDLPILEWSSANPPSLTASPSAGILKRSNQSLMDITGDVESLTPNKRKRVSFADPPVSQKMGYEVATGESPHKISRATRGSHSIRRDTPLKARQSRIRMFQVDVEKVEKSEEQMELSLNGTDIEKEKSGQSVQVSDTLEFSEDTLMKIHGEINESNQVSRPESINLVKLLPNSSKEIIQNPTNQKSEAEHLNTPSAGLIEEIFGTQEDMFSANDTSDESLKGSNQSVSQKGNAEDISHQIMIDKVKLNTTNDWPTQRASLSKDASKNVSLEDTVDIQNFSSFDSTNVGGFCEKSTKCSTRMTDAEQDTLPITDSVFENISQETQNSMGSIVNLPKPETFDSTYPIFPTLLECKDPVKLIVDSLANPLWINHLETCLASREIHTIGDLAKLSEREVNRIPFKGNPKVTFVKNVLTKFENEKTGIAIPRTEIAHLEKTSTGVTPQSKFSNKKKEMSATTPVLSNLDLDSCKAQSTSVAQEAPCMPGSQLSKLQPQSLSKSVSVQMELADLLDEIDVNLVLESAARRCTPESLLAQYKIKMRNMPETELESETLRMLGINSKPSPNEMTLKSACKACGINKVLVKLPDIFSGDKQFFVKVLSAYKKKIQISDCLSALDINELKDALCQKCKSSELAELLSKSLKDDEEKGISEPMEDLSDFARILKRVPADLLISHTVANDELIPSHIVLDIALQNSSDDAIAQTLNAQSEIKKESVFHKLWTLSSVLSHVEKEASEAEVLEIIRAIGLRLRPEKLLEAFRDSMKEDNDSSEKVLLGLFKVISTKLKPDKLLDIFYECMKNKLSLNDS